MKSKYALIVTLTVISMNCLAQNELTAFSKRSSAISLGYGIGNVWKTLLKKTTSYPGGNYKISSTGPFSFAYEYGFTKRISAGIALGYSQAKRIFYFSTSTNTEKLSNFASIARANYHIGKWPKTDLYAGFGLGYYKFTLTSVDNTGSSTPTLINEPGALGGSLQLGLKYYFTPVIGVIAEVGYVAGSYAQVGVTAKF